MLVLRDDPVCRESWLSVKVNPERETQTVQLLELLPPSSPHLVTGDTWLKSDTPPPPPPPGCSQTVPASLWRLGLVCWLLAGAADVTCSVSHCVSFTLGILLVSILDHKR